MLVLQVAQEIPVQMEPLVAVERQVLKEIQEIPALLVVLVAAAVAAEAAVLMHHQVVVYLMGPQEILDQHLLQQEAMELAALAERVRQEIRHQKVVLVTQVLLVWLVRLERQELVQLLVVQEIPEPLALLVQLVHQVLQELALPLVEQHQLHGQVSVV